MRIESLTFFRFIAASIVVIFHYGRGTTLVNLAPKFLTAGPEMVSFFFVLSGFVLMIAYWNRESNTKRFLQARMARITPVYYLALGATLLLGSINFEKWALALNVLFLQSWVPPYPLSLNSPAWSLSIEMFFYLSFPVTIKILRSKPIQPLKLFGLTFAFWLFTQSILISLLNSSFYRPYPSTSHDLIYYFPLSHLSTFTLGVAGGYYYLTAGREKTRPSWLLLSGFLATCVSIFYAISYKGIIAKWFGMKIPFAAGSFAPLFLLLILFATFSQKTRMIHLLSNRFFALLGNASYAVYIFQLPFHQFMETYIFPTLNLSEEASFYFYFFALTVFSILVYFLFEKPLKKLIIGKAKNQ
jgi:peptidoglycan/LPS O-acetylase OafA/YrhL